MSMNAAARPDVRAFHDAASGSVAYVVSDPGARSCAVIDPVLGFDAASGQVDTSFADDMAAFIAAEGLSTEWVLDTHPHADHFSAVAYLGAKLNARTGTGAKVRRVQALWAPLYNTPALSQDGGRYWDRLLEDGDSLPLGRISMTIMDSPGHTAASVTVLAGDAAFIHDTLFMPDVGTARADFPGGGSQALHESIQRILALPDDTRLFTGHDYPPGGREPRWESSVAQQRRNNPWLSDGADGDAFARRRDQWDRELPLPDLMLKALQVNLRGGRMPEAEEDGHCYLKIPVGRFADACPKART
ncbi:MBL fold metallo-hydrolase [Teichococcus aestuarii]|uniref:MBL fold metallo-hydrolase n=1 Tax=Teichococcus aestuarii TaxID=568898 RepID=A0A2U1UYV2_9PROT|nr:MBL fold metallo-hydrolase [Pseudoroseomonas aestuarii]PWC26838.1 MBL fold metallo-hydrolase [Pseudoroseomonas aestuarii]